MPLSKTSKLSGVKSWSLQAGATCPGSIGADACRGCYALSETYRFKSVKDIRAKNKEEWKSSHWIDDMIVQLQNERFFRWFDSGDIYSLQLANKIYQIIKNTPHCQHWIPTRMYKFKKYKYILDEINSLPNAVVRFSSDSITGEYVQGLHGSVIIPAAKISETKASVCESYKSGTCGTCRKCYNKEIPIIAYVAHGRSMLKLLKLEGII